MEKLILRFNSLFIVAIALLFLIMVNISLAETKQEEEQQQMSKITQEIVSLKDNVRNYIFAKSAEYSSQASDVLKRQKEMLQQLSATGKEKLQEQYDQLNKEYEDAKSAAQDKQQELYEKLADNLEKFNKELEKEIDKTN